MSEAKFLKNYDKTIFDSPIFTVDSVLFTCHDDRLRVLLVKRANHPDQNHWGLPGGFIDLSKDNTLEDAVIRILQEKTGIEPPYIEQLECRGNAQRDKRGWSVTACYTALIAYQDCSTHIDTVSDAQWHSIDDLETLDIAFDHKALIEYSRERLKQKALYSIVPAFALPKAFTLPELQRVHELVIGKPIQKSSFRRRIDQAELLIDTGKKHAGGKRQAVLYTMKEAAGGFRFVRNLEQ